MKRVVRDQVSEDLCRITNPVFPCPKDASAHLREDRTTLSLTGRAGGQEASGCLQKLGFSDRRVGVTMKNRLERERERGASHWAYL